MLQPTANSWSPLPGPLSQSTHSSSSNRKIPIIPSVSVEDQTNKANENVVEKEAYVQNSNHILRDRLRLLSAFWMFFTCGWADGVTGTLLPDFQSTFQLSYMQTSLLFIANTVGFTCGTCLIDIVRRLLGRFDVGTEDKCSLKALIVRLRSITLGSLAHVLNNEAGYSHSQSRLLVLLFACTAHACFFIIMGNSRGLLDILGAYFISSFSRSFLSATINAYIASVPQKPLGQLHGSWGLGAFMAPLVCQSIVAKGVAFERFFLGSLVLSAINVCLVVIAFHPGKEEFAAERRMALKFRAMNLPSEQTSPELAVCHSAPHVSTTTTEEAEGRSLGTCEVASKPLKAVLSIPLVWAFCLFAGIYSGSETTTQAYIVTYLLSVRHSNAETTGYVTSGFWAGMCISRLTWGFLSTRLTFSHRKYIIHGLMYWFVILNAELSHQFLGFTGIALAMHLTIWLVDSVVENAIASSIVGLVYGPIFPGSLGLATDLLSRDTHLLSMAIMSAFGNLGSSIFPFLTGSLANTYSPKILPYVTFSQAGTMFLIWFFFPSKISARRAQDMSEVPV